MDILKAEIEKKRKLNSESSSASNSNNNNNGEPSKKYVRKAELEAEREREYLRRKEEEDRKREERRKAKEKSMYSRSSRSPSVGNFDDKSKTDKNKQEDDEHGQSGEHHRTTTEAFNISNEEAVRRLRSKGQPIRLFAESDRDRRLRLRALELIEERSVGQQNDFMRALENTDKGLDLDEVAKRSKSSGTPQLDRVKENEQQQSSRESSSNTSQTTPEAEEDKPPTIDMDLLNTDPNKLYAPIYLSIKRFIKEWEKYMAERPDHVKRSTQGKQAAAVQIQSVDYLKPLLRSLRKKEIAPDVLGRLAEICYYAQQREYLKANDSYLQLSIGNAPWPIGVTMVGIHERSGREKIFSSNVAHVLNDEVSRKYIQSLKRVLTFAQSKWPPADLSQRMG